MNRHLLSRAILFAVVMFCWAIPPTTLPAVEEERSPEKTETEIGQLEEAIQLLEDPEALEALSAKLKILLDARRKLIEEEKEEVAEPKEARPSLLTILESYKNQTVSSFEKFLIKTRDVPKIYDKARAYLSIEENREKVLSFLMEFSICLLSGIIIWWGFRIYTKRFVRRHHWGEPSTRAEKTRAAFVATAYKIYPWIGLYLFCYLFLLIYSISEDLKSIILYGLLLLVVYIFLKSFIKFLLSPADSGKRAIPVGDELAAYIYIWARRILLFTLWMYLLIIPSNILHWPAGAKLFAGIHKVGLVVMAAVILAQWKEGIEKKLHLGINEEDQRWKCALKNRFNYVTGKLYLLVIIYLGLVAAFFILGFPQGATFLLSSAVKTGIVLALTALLWFLWGIAFKKLFKVGSTLKEKYPRLEKQVNRYISILKRSGYVVIIVLAVLPVLDIWGLNVFDYMASNASLVQSLVHIFLIILAAVILTQVSSFLIMNLEEQAASRMYEARKTASIEVEKRVSTIGRIMRKVISITIITLTVMLVFAELGFDIKPILAGAGIIGLAVGFGAQNLVRDVISGLFLIAENRIRVNDVAIINGTGGLVEQVNLRTTVLRGLDGTIHVFPNGAIESLSNMTHEFSYYLFDIGVAYKEDTDRVVEVLKEVGEDMQQDDDFKDAIIEPLDILGVDQFADSAVVIKARIKTLPIRQWAVGREMNRRIKKRFDEVGIEIPFPHMSVYFGEASKAFGLKMEGLKENREELKQLVREVIQEKN